MFDIHLELKLSNWTIHILQDNFLCIWIAFHSLNAHAEQIYAYIHVSRL